MDNILEVEDLHYTYEDGTHSLNGVNLKVKKGGTTAILGGNGAGKSTLFLTLNGIYKPSKGQILFNGKPIDYTRNGIKGLRKSIGIVFQDPDRQIFSASVYQDISFGAMNLKLPEDEVWRRVNTAMERMGISNLKDKPTHCLSFGQKKRVAIAGVLVMEPDVFILDEPTAGLDPIGAEEILKLIKETQRDLGMSVVISTHDIDIVPIYCDYAYVMNAGKIISEGTPKEIFAAKEEIRSAKLKQPLIGQLMCKLKENDGFDIKEIAFTIPEARSVMKEWRERNYK